MKNRISGKHFDWPRSQKAFNDFFEDDGVVVEKQQASAGGRRTFTAVRTVDGAVTDRVLIGHFDKGDRVDWASEAQFVFGEINNVVIL